MLAFKYISVVYAFFLVILVIWFMNKCGGRCFRITTIKSSVIHGMSAFLIMCYSQSIRVSHSLLDVVELWPRKSSNITLSKRVWLDGNAAYFSRRHLVYALPAIFCLLAIGILPPLLLLSYPLLNKAIACLGFEEFYIVKCVSQKLPISNLKPFLDSFQVCFKDNLRFFAGLYFLYQWTIPAVYSITFNLETAYSITEVFLMLMLAVHAFSQPYIKRVHNMIDTILFTDLLLINSITCIHYFLFYSQEDQHIVNKTIAKTAVIQALLIYLPFIVMVIYVPLCGCKHTCKVWYIMHGQYSRLFDVAIVSKLKIVSLSLDGDQELPYRHFSDTVSFDSEQFQDTDCVRETY